MAGTQLTLNARNYGVALLVLVLLFVGAHLGLYYYHYQVEELPWLLLQLFDLDEENNLPTWFSGFLLLNNALVLLLIASGEDNHRAHWSVLALGFLVLSVDEVAGLHETLNTATEISWAIPAAVLVAVVGLLFIPFLLALERRLALLFVLSGLLFVSGAIGVELLSEDMEEESMAYAWATAAEEGMEMLGALLFLRVNLSSLKQGERVELRIC